MIHRTKDDKLGDRRDGRPFASNPTARKPFGKYLLIDLQH